MPPNDTLTVPRWLLQGLYAVVTAHGTSLTLSIAGYQQVAALLATTESLLQPPVAGASGTGSEAPAGSNP